MSWISEIAKMLPVVVLTIIVLFVGMMLGSVNTHRATGLAAVMGTIAERLITVGILNLVTGFILWRVLVIWLRTGRP